MVVPNANGPLNFTAGGLVQNCLDKATSKRKKMMLYLIVFVVSFAVEGHDQIISRTSLQAD